jgi:hypothetical protein
MPRYPATKIPPSCQNISMDLAKRVLAETWGNISEAADAPGVPSRSRESERRLQGPPSHL